MRNVPRSPEEYRRWWEESTDIPYGYCWCGCGEKTKPANGNYKGYVVGEPVFYHRFHGRRGKREDKHRQEYREQWKKERPDIPYGLCWCGCGEETTLANASREKWGHARGEPKKYKQGHQRITPHAEQVEEHKRLWRLEAPAIPYGYCQCGCRQKTKIAPSSGSEPRRKVRGEPMRFLLRHKPPKKEHQDDKWTKGPPSTCLTLSVVRFRACKLGGCVKPLTATFFRLGADGNFMRSCRVCSKIKWKPGKIASEQRRRAAKYKSDSWFTEADIRQMYADQGGLCAYCETGLNGTYHTDHMIPLSRGGSNDALNIALTCALCNLSKGIETVEEYFAEYLA